MLPTLLPGDRLYVDREAYQRNGPAVGDLVVLHDPERPERLLVKRVGGRGPATYWVTRTGFRRRTAANPDVPPPDSVESVVLEEADLLVLSDHPPQSRDSRRFGPVSRDSIVGEAYYRYAPVERRGTLSSGAPPQG